MRSVSEARAWLDACYHGGPAGVVFAQTGLEFIKQFPDDEDLSATILAYLSFVPNLPEPLVAEARAALERFVKRWPNSDALRQVPISGDDAESVRVAMDSMPGPSPEQRQTVNRLVEDVQAGRAPLALLAGLMGRPLTALVISRSIGPLIAVSPQDATVGLETARVSIGQDVVADLAALHLVAELVDDQPALQSALSVAHRQVNITESVARDITNGTDILSRPIAGTWIPAMNGNPGYFSEVTDTERARVARCVAQLNGRLAMHRVVPDATEVTVFDRPIQGSELAVWDRPIQFAFDKRLALWSDDVVTRVCARQAGVRAFSTLDLLRSLSQRDRVTSTQLARALHCMVARGIADVPLTTSLLVGVAADSDWRTSFAGSALSRPQAWTNPDDTLETWIGVITVMPDRLLENIVAWTFAATTGAVRAPYVLGAPAARSVVARLLAAVVYRTAGHPTILANSIKGCAEAVKLSGVAVEDPLSVSVQYLRDILVRRFPSEQVAPYLLAAFSQCDDSVQSTVRISLLQ